MKPETLAKALKIGTLPVVLKRKRGSWSAFLPSVIDKNGYPTKLSDVSVCDFGHMGVRQLRLTITSRYGAEIGVNSMDGFINLRNSMKMPNWAAPYGALNELVNAMVRAGLITN